MSNAAALIEQAREAGMVLWYDDDEELYTWSRTGADKVRRRQLTRRLQAQYFEVLTLLKLAVLETA